MRSNSSVLKKNISMMLKMLNCVKLYHWKTFKYSEHIATDGLYKSLDSHVDKFVEVMMGRIGQHVKNVAVTVESIKSRDEFVRVIKSFIVYFEQMRLETDLMSIRDEIVADLNQFLYLLTLR